MWGTLAPSSEAETEGLLTRCVDSLYHLAVMVCLYPINHHKALPHSSKTLLFRGHITLTWEIEATFCEVLAYGNDSFWFMLSSPSPLPVSTLVGVFMGTLWCF